MAQDNEIRQKKEACYTDVEKYVMMRSCCLSVQWNASDAMFLSSDGCFSRPCRSGLWGWVCRSSPTEKENCVLRCLSPECYELIYGGDPVSGGIRMWGFSSCDIYLIY